MEISSWTLKVTDFIFGLVPTGLTDFHVAAEKKLDATNFLKIMWTCFSCLTAKLRDPWMASCSRFIKKSLFQWPREGLSFKFLPCNNIYLTHCAIRLNRLRGFGVPEFATLWQESKEVWGKFCLEIAKNLKKPFLWRNYETAKIVQLPWFFGIQLN